MKKSVKKQGNKNKKTIKNYSKLTNYLFTRPGKDICCEEEYKRESIVDLIVSNYKEMYPTEYIAWIDNDLIKFIGYGSTLQDKKDKVGMRLWDSISKKTRKFNEKQMRNFLLGLPLYYLLSFLGRSYYMKIMWA